MDFKSIITKISSLNDEVKTVAAPELPKAVQLNEDAELRVLAGTSSYIAEAKKKAEEKKEEKVEEEMKVGDKKTSSTGGTIEKTATGIKHTAGKHYGGSEEKDEDDDAEHPKDKKAKKAKKESIDPEQFKAKFSKMVEAAKPDFLDLDKDGNKKEPMKKAAADKGGDKKDGKKGMSAKQEKYFGKKNESVEEGSTGDYSAKKARAGKDIGKPGKMFSKIAKSAGERYGSKERGEKVAGAVLAKLRGKNESVEEANDHKETKLIRDLRAKGLSDKEIVRKMKEIKHGTTKTVAKEGVESKKAMVAESVEQKLSFKEMIKLVVESGGQQQIDPKDKELFAWAERVARNKYTESMQQQVYAGLVYERMGGVFEMYDVLSEDQK